VSLATSRARLQGAVKELLVQWEAAKAKWDDPMSREIEKRYLLPLEPRVRNTLAAMEKMEATLARARRDCS
jgi:hypothetical protein